MEDGSAGICCREADEAAEIYLIAEEKFPQSVLIHGVPERSLIVIQDAGSYLHCFWTAGFEVAGSGGDVQRQKGLVHGIELQTSLCWNFDDFLKVNLIVQCISQGDPSAVGVEVEGAENKGLVLFHAGMKHSAERETLLPNIRNEYAKKAYVPYAPVMSTSVISKKQIWLWALYDLANSMGFLGVTFYFGLWFVADLGGSEAWMSAAVGLSTIALVCTLPFFGRRSDDTGRRKSFLTVFSILCMAALALLGLYGGGVTSLSRGSTLLIIALYFFVQYFYQAGLAFYDAFLKDLTHDARGVDGLSGLGMAMGQVGNVVALACLYPVAQGTISIGSLAGKPAAFVVSAILFLISALPVFLYLRDPPSVSRATHLEGFGATVKATLKDLRAIRTYPGVLPFLIAYYLFADAMLTLALFITLYLDVVGHLSDLQKNLALLMALLLGIAGGLLAPACVRLFHGRKRALRVLVAVWTVFVLWIAVARTPLMFMIVASVNGFVYGALFALARSFFATLVPQGKQAEFFSVFVLFERTASILGPILWSATAALFASYGPDKYRFSVAVLALLVGISFFVLRKVREPDSP